MLSIDTTSGIQSGTRSGADKGPDKQPGTIAATSSENRPAVLGQAGSAAAAAGSPHDKGNLHCRRASRKCAVGSVHFAAEVVELAPQQDNSPAQSGSGIAQQGEQQQQCNSNVSSVGNQQAISSGEAAHHAQHDRATGPLKAKQAGPAMKADGHANYSRLDILRVKATLKTSSSATEIAAPVPRYVGSLIADLDPQLVANLWNKQKRGFSFRSKGPEVASEGSQHSSGAASVGSARASTSSVKP